MSLLKVNISKKKFSSKLPDFTAPLVAACDGPSPKIGVGEDDVTHKVDADADVAAPPDGCIFVLLAAAVAASTSTNVECSLNCCVGVDVDSLGASGAMGKPTPMLILPAFEVSNTSFCWSSSCSQLSSSSCCRVPAEVLNTGAGESKEERVTLCPALTDVVV